MAQRRENIVMFPFMAQGHIIPFLALAHKLERTRGCSIYFVNTPANIKKLRASIAADSSIHLLEIPFKSTDYGLPPNTENTDSLPYDLVVALVQASLSLKPTFKKLITDLVHEHRGQKPLCIVADMFFSWSAEVAHELGVFHALFIGGCGFGFACYYSLWMNLPHLNSNSDEFEVPDFPEAFRLHVTQLSESLRAADGRDSFSVFQKKVLSRWVDADGILFNTVEELDVVGLSYIRRNLGRPAWPIGPALLSTETQARAGKEAGITPELCKNWLDTKPLSSVLYVSFGSQNTISASQMMQLAMALEACGKDFIWVVRPPLGFDINSEFKSMEWLPQGYEERIKESSRGLLVPKWAPQVEILSHKSVSAFLSHCGWNSLLEALSHCVPILGWPLAAEQFYNVKFLEEQTGVCVEIVRGRTCEVRHEDVAAKINLVMNETEKGKAMRRKAMEIKEIIKTAIKDEENFKGSSVGALDEFLRAALMMKSETETNQETEVSG